MEQAKPLSDDVFRALVENSYDGVALVGADGSRLYVSPVLLRMLGYTKEEFDEVKPFEIIHPDDRATVNEAFRAAAESKGPVKNNARARRKDGSLRYWEGTISNRLDDPDIRALVVNWRDITELKLADMKRAEASESLRRIVEASPLAIVSLDRDLNVVSWNPSAEKLFGYKAEEVLGRPYPVVPEEEKKTFDQLVSREMEGEPFQAVETKRKRKDGSLVDVSVSGAPLRAPDGEIVGIVSMINDITDRKRAEEALQASVEALRKTDDERRLLLANLVTAQEEERRRIASEVHDDSIQVMTAVNLRLQMILRELGDNAHAVKVAGISDTVEKATRRLRHLIFELTPPALTRHGLVPALTEYLDQLRQDSGLEFEIQDELEAEPEESHRIVAYRIAQEALTNIRKHAGANKIRILAVTQKKGLLVRITDDGLGFDPEKQQDPAPGHLGLPNMRQRAQLAGGWWKIQSSPGSGTTVEFWIPERPAVDAFA